MIIPILTSHDKFYSQLVSLFSNFAPIKSLSNREKSLLIEILNQNYKYRNIPEDSRYIVLFSTENRITMAKNIGISVDALYVLLSNIRKKGAITSDNRIPAFLAKIVPEDTFEFTILFKIKDEE